MGTRQVSSWGPPVCPAMNSLPSCPGSSATWPHLVRCTLALLPASCAASNPRGWSSSVRSEGRSRRLPRRWPHAACPLPARSSLACCGPGPRHLLRSWAPSPASPGAASAGTGYTGSASSPEAARPSPGKVASLHCVTHTPLCPCAPMPLRPFLRLRQVQEGEEMNAHEIYSLSLFPHNPLSCFMDTHLCFCLSVCLNNVY